MDNKAERRKFIKTDEVLTYEANQKAKNKVRKAMEKCTDLSEDERKKIWERLTLLYKVDWNK